MLTESSADHSASAHPSRSVEQRRIISAFVHCKTSCSMQNVGRSLIFVCHRFISSVDLHYHMVFSGMTLRLFGCQRTLKECTLEMSS